MKVLMICLFVIALAMINGCAISCLAIAYRQDNMEISAEFSGNPIDQKLSRR